MRQRKSKQDSTGELAVTVANAMMGTWLIRKGPSGRIQSCVQGNGCEAEIAPLGRETLTDVKAGKAIFGLIYLSFDLR